MPFTKGQSGNPNGRPRKRRALAELLRTVGNKKLDDKKTRKRALAEKVWELALAGDLQATRLIYEYTDGKPAQVVQHTGNVDDPVRLVVEYVNDWHEDDTTSESTSGATGDSE